MTLDQLQALLDAATPGDWYDAGCSTVHDGEHQEVAHPYNMAHVPLIVAMRNELPKLLACVRAADDLRALEFDPRDCLPASVRAYDTARREIGP